MSASSNLPSTLSLNPYLIPSARQRGHARTISAPITLSSPPAYSVRPITASSSSRPNLRVITSFPLPPPRRPKMRPHAQSLAASTSTVLVQPIPIRHPSLQPLRTAPLPTRATESGMGTARSSSHRKAVPNLHVDVDVDDLPARTHRPEPARTSSIDKRRNREAVIISTEMYTSYHPSRDWGLSTSGEAAGTVESPTGVIPASSRPSGRGHKRTFSDKFKSLFSPPPRPPQLQLSTPVADDVSETFERVALYDDGEVPTYSATYPQPDDPFHLALPGSMGLAVEQPGRPYRSPGTASFLVNREEEIWAEVDENAARRNTFGVVLVDRMGDVEMGYGEVEDKEDEHVEGGTRVGSLNGDQADDEMSASTDQEGEILLAYLNGREGQAEELR